MRKLIVPALLVGSLALGSAAFAATPPAASTNNAAKEKTASCEAAWKAQKHHTGKRSAFMKACVAKG